MTDIPSINIALYAQTDVGMVRSGNEDNFLVLDLSTGTSWSAGEHEPEELLTFPQGYYGSLLAVSDGMGGALAGEVASRLAVETVRDRMLQLQAHNVFARAISFHERLRLSIEQANDLIHTDGLNDPSHKGLGATFTAVATLGHQAYFAQVGDSRAYLIRQGKIARITKDQSLVQQLIDAGQISEEEAETHSYRNVILQALGAQNLVAVEVNTLTLCNLDTLVLCSDGLSGKIQTHEIADIVNQADDFKTACQNLIALANQRGGDDNITVVIAQFSGTGLQEPTIESIEPQGIARSPDTPSEIDWGAEEAAFSAAGAPTGDLNQNGAATVTSASQTSRIAATPATDPLHFPAAPAPPPPNTSPLIPRKSTNAITNNLADRTGPPTAVFEVGDFAELDPASPEQALNDSRDVLLTAAQDVAKKTAPLSASPLPSISEARFSYLMVMAALLIALLGIGGVFAWRYQRQRQEKKEAAVTAQMVRESYESVKQTQVATFTDRIADLEKKLGNASKISGEEQKKLQDRLEKARQDLVRISQLPAELSQQLKNDFDQLEKDLKQIEDTLNTLQGLLHPLPLEREPINC